MSTIRLHRVLGAASVVAMALLTVPAASAALTSTGTAFTAEAHATAPVAASRDSPITPVNQCSEGLCRGAGSGGGGGIGGGTGMALPEVLPGVPGSWIEKPTRTGGGVSFQKYGSTKDSDSVRVMPPGADPRYPRGYVRFTNGRNQKLQLNGHTGDDTNTHIPRDSHGSWPVPKTWKY